MTTLAWLAAVSRRSAGSSVGAPTRSEIRTLAPATRVSAFHSGLMWARIMGTDALSAATATPEAQLARTNQLSPA